MILNALLITGIGMGGVFAFLMLLMAGMSVLHRVIEQTASRQSDKIAVAIAAAKAREAL